METLIFLIVGGVALGYWLNGLRARELALKSARLACNRENVQLLDETVVLSRVRPTRDAGGQPCWRRHYHFEFSDDGGSRRDGQLEMVGMRTVSLQLNLPDHTLHELQ